MISVGSNLVFQSWNIQDDLQNYRLSLHISGRNKVEIKVARDEVKEMRKYVVGWATHLDAEDKGTSRIKGKTVNELCSSGNGVPQLE